MMHHEFIGDDRVGQFELKNLDRMILPNNKYISDDSGTDSSQLIKIRNTIL